MAFDEHYRAFVARQPHATLWHEPALLEALTAHDTALEWEYAAVGLPGEPRGVLPFCRKARPDGWVVTMPALVRYCGPLVGAIPGASATEPDRLTTNSPARALLSAVPAGFNSYDQSWPEAPGSLAGLPPGFRLTPRTTHTVDLGRHTEASILRLPRKKSRDDLRRAGRHYEIRHLEALTPEVHDVLEAPFVRQRVAVPYRREAVDALFELLVPARRAVAVCGHDAGGRLVAASVFVADAHTGYALLTGALPEARVHSAGTFVLWHGLLWAHRRGLRTLDFLGSDHPGIAANLRHLGGKPQAYSHLYCDTRVWTRLLRAWRQRGSKT